MTKRSLHRLHHPRSVVRAHLRQVCALGAGLAGISLLAAACGAGAAPGVASIGSTTTEPTASAVQTPPQSGTVPAELDRYSVCMRSHGVPNFPNPVASNGHVQIRITGLDPNSSRFQTAQNACRKLLPTGGGQGAGAKITPADQADYLKAVACMHAHGINGFPDPILSNGTVRFVLPTGMDPNATPFLKARAICEKLIPAGLPYSS